MKKIIIYKNYLLPLLAVEIISLLILFNKVDSFPLAVVIISYLIITSLHIYSGRTKAMLASNFFQKLGTVIASEKEADRKESYEEKISRLNSIINEMKNSFQLFSGDDDYVRIYNGFLSIAGRLADELNSAKIFKVNRNEFLGNVAHELRTPIFAIQLSLETLADGAVNDPSVNIDFLNKAERQTKRLKELVDDLIQISKLEEGMKLSKRYFSLNQLIRETLNEMSEIAAKKKISLKFKTMLQNESVVFADRERIKQVLVNLVDNSSKYTLENGSIIISTTPGDKCINISVKDTGLGIPKNDLPRIFERFYRVDKTRSRDNGGSGLGLSIVKHILELHGSRITVESEQAKGTEFVFNLPV